MEQFVDHQGQIPTFSFNRFARNSMSSESIRNGTPIAENVA